MFIFGTLISNGLEITKEGVHIWRIDFQRLDIATLVSDPRCDHVVKVRNIRDYAAFNTSADTFDGPHRLIPF